MKLADAIRQNFVRLARGSYKYHIVANVRTEMRGNSVVAGFTFCGRSAPAPDFRKVGRASFDARACEKCCERYQTVITFDSNRQLPVEALSR